MKITYKVLAYLVAALVAVQAAVMVWAIAGLGIWVDGGGVLDSSMMEDESSSAFPEEAGFGLHAMNGMMLIPAVALILLVISLFLRNGRAVRWAGLVFLLVGVQITLGLFGHEVAALGALHGINALLLFFSAITAGRIGTREKATAGTQAAVDAEKV